MSGRVQILDHGFLELVETWGSDERIVEAARMSTGKGFLGWGSECRTCKAAGRQYGNQWTYAAASLQAESCEECQGKGGVSGDEKLLKHLYENKHATPFEMAGLVLEIQAPIFVFREHQRHRTQSYNEMSARYTPLPDLNYVPTVERLLINSKTNKQAGTIKGAGELTAQGAEDYRFALEAHYERAEELYQDALVSGVPKELARIHLPVGRYSRMRASANLRNWLAFMTLRSAPSAQWEIRQYSDAVGKIIEEKFPRTWALFAAGRPT